MSHKFFALVKWIGGQDDKKYTTDVPVNWIKDFDVEYFESDKFDPSLSYVIEWHSTKKMPIGGWPVHDGYVIAVSRSIPTLENKLKTLDGILSPKSKAIENVLTVSNNTGTESVNPNGKLSKLKTTVESMDTGTSEVQQLSKPGKKGDGTDRIKNSKPCNSKPASGDNSRRDVAKNNPPMDSNSDSSDNEFTDVSGCARINKKNKRSSKQLYKETPETAQDASVVRALTALRNEIKRMRKRRSDSSNSSTGDEDEKKEIGRRGSGIFISITHWDAARATRSYTAMGISLMLSLFPMNILLVSNLRGGYSKLHGSEKRPNRPALDKKIVEALFYTVRKNWKKTFTQSELGIALNSKLTQLRSSQKKNAVVE